MSKDSLIPNSKIFFFSGPVVKGKFASSFLQLFSILGLASVTIFFVANAYIQKALTSHSENMPVQSELELAQASQGYVLQASTIQTANPNASEDSKRLLNWISNLPNRTDTRVISGQHAGSSSFERQYQTHIVDLSVRTGKYVGLMGLDLAWMDRNHATDWPEALPIIIDYWNQKGLISISWEAPNPAGSGIVNMAQLTTPGNATYNRWMTELEDTARKLAELQTAGVVVLWRPLLEMNLSRSSHWWCQASQQDFVNVWRHMFDFFTKDKELNNLLWVYSPATSSSSTTYYYPGGQYVDIVGQTFYIQNNPLSGIGNRGYNALTALGKPYALSEFGPGTGSTPPAIKTFNYQTLINGIKEYCPKTTYFMSWYEERAIYNQNNASGLLNDSWIITREEVDWKPTENVIFYDINNDSRLDILDLTYFLQNWGTPTPSRLDFNNDKIINSADYKILVNTLSL